mmetsp:Transcript_7833/g.20426  ORF Transcript_7833/g.20426 Transcript_7833/m.20426 type:complete len:251 (-) Transcript_7833:6-758(-)
MSYERHAVLVHRHAEWATDQNILGLQIGVDDVADSVEVVETDEGVRRYLAGDVERNTLEVVALDEGEHVRPHDLEHHAHVLAVRAVVLKLVEQRHYAGEGQMGQPVRQGPRDLAPLPGLAQACLWAGRLREQLDLVVGGLGVVRGTLLDLHGHEAALPRVLAEPHRREVSPAQLGQHPVAPVVDLPDGHDVVAAPAVPLGALVVALGALLLLHGLAHGHPGAVPALSGPRPPAVAAGLPHAAPGVWAEKA